MPTRSQLTKHLWEIINKIIRLLSTIINALVEGISSGRLVSINMLVETERIYNPLKTFKTRKNVSWGWINA